MSDQVKLFEKFDKLLIKNDVLFNEAVENAVPKIPHLMNDSDIRFLEYFPQKYWAQALSKRFDELYEYLTNLAILRKVVHDAVLQKYRKQEENEWNDPKYAGISDLAKQQLINLQSDARAKAIASKMFPAGYRINYADLFKRQYAPYFASLPNNKKEEIENVVTNINDTYLPKDRKLGVYGGLRVGNEQEKAYWAPSFLDLLARELEGTYGTNDGYDLNNPKKIGGSVAGKDSVKYATDGFVFPTATTLEKQILRHLKAIGADIAKPVDNVDQSRLDAKETVVPFGKTDDEGVGEMEKQLRSMFERIIANERRANNLPRLKRNILRQEAIKRSLQYLETYTGDNIKKQINNLLSSQYKDKKLSKAMYDQLAKEAANIVIPYENTEIVKRGGQDNRLSISRKKEVQIPQKTVQVLKAVGDKKVPENIQNAILIKSTLHKPVKLTSPQDDGSVTYDTTYTDLRNPADALGEKLFDPILFERLLRRRNARFKNTTKGKEARDAVQKILDRHGLTFTSSLQDVINASKRYFKQKANMKDYTQGSNVSATFGLHPTRMSAQSNFLNKHHSPMEHATAMDIFMNNGVYMGERNGVVRALPTLEYIQKFVNDWLYTFTGGDKLNKLFLRRVENILVSLGQLKILENLDTPNLYYAHPPKTKENPNPPQTYYLRQSVVDRLLKNELLRYSRQDFFTGSRRKRGTLIDTLEQSSDDLSCKIGQRSWRTSLCLHGADVRSLNAAAQTGTDIVRSIDSEKSHVLMDAKKQIRLAIEGYWDLFKVLYTLYKLEEEKTLKSPKTPADEEKIKANSAKKLTDWVARHASKDIDAFVGEFYTEYNRLISILKPKNLELPANLRDKKGRLKPLKDLRQSVGDQVSSNTGRTVYTNQANLSSEQISTLVGKYHKDVNLFPFRFEQIRNEYLENLPPVTRGFFERSNKKFDANIVATYNQINNPSNVMSEFLHNILHATESPDEAKNYFVENSKFLKSQTLMNLFDHFLMETYPPPEFAVYRGSMGDAPSKDPVLKQQRNTLGTILYGELSRRDELDKFKIRSQLLDSLKQFLRTPKLAALVNQYITLINSATA